MLKMYYHDYTEPLGICLQGAKAEATQEKCAIYFRYKSSLFLLNAYSDIEWLESEYNNKNNICNGFLYTDLPRHIDGVTEQVVNGKLVLSTELQDCLVKKDDHETLKLETIHTEWGFWELIWDRVYHWYRRVMFFKVK